MTLTRQTLYGGAVLIILAVMYLLGASVTRVGASTGFVPATIATTSVMTVNGTASLVLATSSCATRIISTTVAGGIMIGFSDNQGFVPSPTQGFWQAASTTIAYDSGSYGCGAVRVYSSVSQGITVSDAR